MAFVILIQISRTNIFIVEVYYDGVYYYGLYDSRKLPRVCARRSTLYIINL